MNPRVTSLAEFKRFLAMPGATVQITRNDWVRGAPKPGYMDPKKVQRLQGNGVQWDTGSWLYFRPAKEHRFDPDAGTMTVALDFENHGFDVVMVYQISLPETAEVTS